MNTFCCGITPYTFKSLTDGRVEFDVTFIYKLLNNDIDAPDLLAKLFLAVPSFYSRNPQTFKTNFHTTNYGYAAPLIVLVDLIIICQILIFLMILCHQ